MLATEDPDEPACADTGESAASCADDPAAEGVAASPERTQGPIARSGTADPLPDRGCRRTRGEGDPAPLLVPPVAEVAAREWPSLDSLPQLTEARSEADLLA